MLPTYTAADFLWQFQRLLPRGRVWHRGWGTLQAQALLTLMPTWVRLHDRLNVLIAEIFPCSTYELLPEWEETLGLPDPCIGDLGTVQQRQAAVCTKFAARGGQSKDYFIAIAAAAGYTITIEEYTPFRASINTAGQPLNGEAWAYAWKINAPPTSVTYFRAGLSTAGEPLAVWGDLALMCLIERYAPAHTIPIFGFGGPTGATVWDAGTSIWDQGESEPWDQAA